MPTRKQREHAGRVHGMLRTVALRARDARTPHQRHVGRAVEQVADLARLVQQLVARHQEEVAVHQFHHRAQARQRRARGQAAEAVFSDRGVHQAARVGVRQPSRGADRAAAHVGHVFAEHDRLSMSSTSKSSASAKRAPSNSRMSLVK
ncbi:hypothetical protein G6F22_017203 [Rhizopus arrhizus]|nr:hypothetical protein G6F22_017203 [Rhizopus arrhizus]